MGETNQEFTVSGGWLSERMVHFRCGGCGLQLECKLADAGKPDHCPACGHTFETPGLSIIEQEKAEERAKVVAEAKRRAEAQRQRQAPPLHRLPPPPRAEKPPEMVWYGQMRCNKCGYVWKARRNTPPARCAGCSSKDIDQVLQPKGCLTMILLVISIAFVPAVVAYALAS